ncbi:MAG: hypothetical protein ACOCQD_05545 [archaeon]
MNEHQKIEFKKDLQTPDSIDPIEYSDKEYSRSLIKQSNKILNILEGYRTSGNLLNFCENSIHLYLLLMKIEIFLKGLYVDFHKTNDNHSYQQKLKIYFGHNIKRVLDAIEIEQIKPITKEFCTILSEKLNNSSLENYFNEYVSLRYNLEPNNNNNKLFVRVDNDMEVIYYYASRAIKEQFQRPTRRNSQDSS